MEYRIPSSNEDEIRNVLVGRKVTGVDEQNDTLSLDDGTILKVRANEGCGGCNSGWFELTQLNSCDNVITKAEIDYQESGDGDVYSLFVYAENTQIKLVESSGNIGNGYYGSGFSITAHRFK